MELNKRHTGLDLLRILAIFFVAGLHFFMNTGFYEQTVDGPRMYIMVLLRNTFMVCVPLFLVMSGAVMGDKKPTAGYFLGIIKVITIYLLASLCCGAYKMFVTHEMNLREMIYGIFTYQTATYGWYVEMYLGLFLLVPFLNMAYDAMLTQKKKKILLGVMLILTALPSVVNIWRLDGLTWWLNPASNQIHHQLVPQYWESLFPLTYFLLGRYLREYPIKMGKGLNVGLIAAVIFFNGAFSYYRSHGDIFVWGAWQSWGALPNVVLAGLIANLFVQIRCEKWPAGLRKSAAMVSNWVLGAYLVSSIFDEVLYDLLNQHVTVMHYRLEWFPVIVLGVAVCSLALSAVLYGIYSVTGAKVMEWLRKKIEK